MTISSTENLQGMAAICTMAVVPVRKEPREQSEIVSQLLFGEYYKIGEYTDNWLNVTTLFDQFTGWIDRKFFHGADMEKGQEFRLQPVLCSILAEVSRPDGTSQLIPAGSTLPFYDPARYEFMIGIQKFGLRPLFGDALLPASQKIYETAAQFLNAPYLWGGRSVFGFDCSGFIQTVYKIHGISLLRETSQQVSAGQAIPSVENAIPGDLAFFCNDEGRVNHVGMVLAEGMVIHCSGWVRIDLLDEKGIFNRERGLYTHRLKEVRRVNGNR